MRRDWDGVGATRAAMDTHSDGLASAAATAAVATADDLTAFFLALLTGVTATTPPSTLSSAEAAV